MHERKLYSLFFLLVILFATRVYTQPVSKHIIAASQLHEPIYFFKDSDRTFKDTLFYRTNSFSKNDFLYYGYFRLKFNNETRYPENFLFWPGKNIECEIWDRNSAAENWHRVIPAKNNILIYGSTVTTSVLLIPSNQKKEFLIHPEIHFYNAELWSPVLIKPGHEKEYFSNSLISLGIPYLTVNLFLYGMLVLLFIYGGWKMVENGRKTFIYNFLYILCFLVLYGYYLADTFSYNSKYPSLRIVFPCALQLAGHIFQILFITYFLNLKESPFLYNALRFFKYVCVANVVLICFFSSDTFYRFEMPFFNSIRISLLVFTIYFMFVVYRKKLYNANYIVLGLLILFVFGAISFTFATILISEKYLIASIGGVRNVFFIGIVGELIVFRWGLGQQERISKQEKILAIQALRRENERKDYETRIAVLQSQEQERTRIAKEMHDDIGSTLTSIRLLSEVALLKPDNRTDIQKISHHSNRLVTSMNEIIWSMNSKNDHLLNLVSYIRNYAVEYFEDSPVNLSVSVPDDIPEYPVNGETRRNLFLVCKESFHNIIKHARATEVSLVISITTVFTIIISDNGVGINTDNIQLHSNGIASMQERLENIGGSFQIEGAKGTRITMEYKLT